MRKMLRLVLVKICRAQLRIVARISVAIVVEPAGSDIRIPELLVCSE
jgi:hypothetical protein